MNKEKTSIKKILKKMTLADFIYLGTIFVFFIIVIFLFINSTNFIVKNINKMFLSDEKVNTPSFDIERYKSVAKKLNLPLTNVTEDQTIETPQVESTLPQNEPTPDNSIINTENTTPPAQPVSIPTPELNKQAVTIGIFNSTTKKGIASTLAQALFDSGFSMAFTGNEKQPYASTTIFIKESKKEYLPFVQEAIAKSYPKVATKMIADDPNKIEFDVRIVIGKK